MSDSVWAVLAPFYFAIVALLTLCNLASLISLFLRLRLTQGDERQQVKWLIIPAILFWLGTPLAFFTDYDSSGIALSVGVGLHLISVPAIVIAVAFAIFKYRLYDIDLIINRTLVYGTLTASVVGLYVLIVGGAGLVIQTNITLAALLVTTVAVGAIYRPMRAFLQSGVDRLMYGRMGVSSHIPLPHPPEYERPDQDALTVPAAKAPVKPPVDWLRFARLAWYPTAALAFGILLAAIPGFFIIGSGGVVDPRFAANPSPWITILLWITIAVAILTSLVSLFLSVLLFRRRSDDRMALLTSYLLLAYGVIMSGPFEALEPFIPGIATFTTSVLIPVFQPFILLLFAVFPDGRFVPRWIRWPILITFLTTPLSLYWTTQLMQSSLDFSQLVMMSLVGANVILAVAVWISIVYAQVYRYRRVSTPQQKQQTKWVMYGIGLWFTIQILSAIPWIYTYSLPPGTPYPAWLAVVTPVWLISIISIPLTLTIAVMRYRLFEIDFIINRTLVYGALTLSVAAIYIVLVMLTVGGLGILFQAQSNLIVALLATGLVAVLFQPLRDRLQRGVNRLIYGERDDPIEVLSRMGKSLETALPPDQLLPTLVETIAQTLKLPFVGIALEGSQSGQLAAQSGNPVENPLAFPLTFQGKAAGQLLVAPRRPDESFTPAEMRLLRNLARQAGAVVWNAQLAADLQRSRQNLVTAREEERHRLRRDLHDGIGPTMAGLTLKLDAAKDLLAAGLETGDTANLEEAMQLLAELKAQTQETVRDIRHIVHALRPPSLDVLGLAPALQAHFGQVAAPANLQIQMTTIPQDFPPLSAAVEVAAYRIVLEAVTNVIQHAKARRCDVSLALDNGHLQVEVTDNGIGVTKDRNYGVGLNSMRERAEELGGRFELNSSQRGTRVCAEIPLP